MERNRCRRIPGTPNSSSRLPMNTIERARAEEVMKQALLLVDLTLAGIAHVRTALVGVGRAMSRVYGRTRAPKSTAALL